jgi:hypothetical protein
MTTGAIVFDHGDDRGLSWAAFFRRLRAASVYLLIALATALVLAAIWPLWQATFSFSDLFRSRILLAAAALPASAALSEASGSKFDLNRFRINPRIGFTIDLSGKLVRFLLVGLALAVPLFVIDPIGVYAASHSKALVPLFYGLKFQGAGILYSWPSGDEVSSYDHDYENASWSAKHLPAVVVELARLGNLQRFHLIAHSMGTRVLTEALDNLPTREVTMPISTNVVLAAADIGETEFLSCPAH